jgi:hypothetical protein
MVQRCRGRYLTVPGAKVVQFRLIPETASTRAPGRHHHTKGRTMIRPLLGPGAMATHGCRTAGNWWQA